MLRNIFFILFITFSNVIIAQRKQSKIPPSFRRDLRTINVLDTAKFTVYYAFNADDVKDEHTYIDLQWLQVGKRISKYSSYYMAKSDSVAIAWQKKNPKARVAPNQKNGGKFPEFWSEYQYDELYITKDNLTEYAIMPINLGRDNCYYSEKLPLQQWNIQDETIDLCGYKCQKATCHWRGRDYIAWFTMDIPIKLGPWKFGGLPGLILKIHDKEKEYSFECVKIEKNNRKITQYNFSRFKKVSREYLLNYQKKLNINWVKASGVIQTSGEPAKDCKYSPLELK